MTPRLLGRMTLDLGEKIEAHSEGILHSSLFLFQYSEC